jgi:hypothetical protein
MSLLKKLEKGFKGLGTAFEIIWINPGHMRWVNKRFPTQFVSTIDFAKFKGTKTQALREKEAKLALIGVLTAPVGLSVALATLPIVFFSSGLPYLLRGRHLDKVTAMVARELKLCSIMEKQCARQIAKLITGIGHPRGGEICGRCQGLLRALANEAADEIQRGRVRVNPEDINRLVEARENDPEVVVE